MEKVIEKYLKYTQKSDNSKILEYVVPFLTQELECQLFSTRTHTVFCQKNISVETMSYSKLIAIIRDVLLSNSAAMQIASTIVIKSVKSITNKDISPSDSIEWIKTNILSSNITLSTAA